VEIIALNLLMDGRLNKDIGGGVGIDYQISNLDHHARLPLAEGGIKLDIHSGAHSFT